MANLKWPHRGEVPYSTLAMEYDPDLEACEERRLARLNASPAVPPIDYWAAEPEFQTQAGDFLSRFELGVPKAEPLTIPSRPIIRQYWQETHSVQQVAERCCISLGLAHRLIVAMLAEEGEE